MKTKNISLIKNVYYFIQGKFRNFVYHSFAKSLLATYIREQIDYRLKVMNPTCYSEGSCVMCGCDTPALQMANKSCPKPCYPEMLSKKNWTEYKKALNKNG